MTVDDVLHRKTAGYCARSVYEGQPRLRQVVDQIAGGEFSPDDCQRFQPIAESLLARNDPFFVLADFAECVVFMVSAVRVERMSDGGGDARAVGYLSREDPADYHEQFAELGWGCEWQVAERGS